MDVQWPLIRGLVAGSADSGETSSPQIQNNSPLRPTGTLNHNDAFADPGEGATESLGRATAAVVFRGDTQRSSQVVDTSGLSTVGCCQLDDVPTHTERGDFESFIEQDCINFDLLSVYRPGSLAGVRCHLAPSVRTTRLRRNRRRGRRFEICRRKLCLGNPFHTVARGFSVCVRYG